LVKYTDNKTVKGLKYFYPLVLAVFVYSFLSITVGQRGLGAYSQLEQEILRQRVNLAGLQEINSGLNNEMQALLYDRDTIAVYARELGYLEEGSRFLRIAGVPSASSHTYNAGQPLEAAVSSGLSNELIRNITLGLTLSLYISIILFEILRRQNRLQESLHTIRSDFKDFIEGNA
jgi:cell division protein FtsB